MSAVIIGSVNCRGISNNVKCCVILSKCRDIHIIPHKKNKKTMAA